MGKIAQKALLEELVSAWIPSGVRLGIGGLHFHNTPMALVREIMRQGIPIRLLVPPLDGSLNADHLIGAGLVEAVQFAYIGMEFFGLASRFRAAAEAGSIALREMDEAGYVLALQAGAAGQPFAALPANFFPSGAPKPTVPDVNATDYRTVVDPFSGQEQMLVRAIAPDVAIIHCQAIDREGNCGFIGAPFLDVAMAKASAVCLVQSEAEVDVLPAACRAHLPGYVVDAYCVLSGGAHPASSHGLYQYDRAHLESYVEASRTDEGFDRYWQTVIGVNEESYRATTDVVRRLRDLAASPP